MIGGEKMPNVVVDGPKLSTEKKRELVEEITESVSKATELPKETIVVTIRENSPENVGVAGQLLIDK